jgi:ubiquitin C-terminal hydrolase
VAWPPIHLVSLSLRCSECDAKVDALRRTALSTLPPVLIIHLKRFEFNLETMTKFKARNYLSLSFSSFHALIAIDPTTPPSWSDRRSHRPFL